MVTGKQILEAIRGLERKIDHMSEAVVKLTTAVTELEADESAAAAAFTTLAKEVEELKAGNISEAEIGEIAEKVTAVGAALKAATPEA